MSTPAVINGQDLSERSHLGSALERPEASLPGSSVVGKPSSFALLSHPEPKKSLWFNTNNEDDVDNHNGSHLLRAPSARHFPELFILVITTLWDRHYYVFSQGNGGSERLSGSTQVYTADKELRLDTNLDVLNSEACAIFILSPQQSYHPDSWSILLTLPKPSIWVFDAFAHSAPAVSSPPLPLPLPSLPCLPLLLFVEL